MTKNSKSLLILLSVLLLVSIAPLAQGYTLVLKSGRRLEVSNVASAGPSVICQVSKDITINIQLASVDIAATDLANNEVKGSFLDHLTVVESPTITTQPSTTSVNKPVVTNEDLETYRQRRVDSERAYDAKQIELGLPTIREAQAQIAERTDNASLNSAAQNESTRSREQYWRERASQLRSEMSMTDEQIRLIQARLVESQNQILFGGFSTIGALPFVSTSRVSSNLGPNFVPGPHIIPQSNPVPNSGRFGRPRGTGAIRGRQLGFSGTPFLAAPLLSYDDGSGNSALIAQLQQLQLQRARLQSLWRDLEEDARHQGAYPGWLRP